MAGQLPRFDCRIKAKFCCSSTVPLSFTTDYQLLALLYLQRRNFESVRIEEIVSELSPEEEAALLTSLIMLVKKGVLKKEGNPVKIESRTETLTVNWELKHKVPKLGCF
jgi:RIO-like serine/threonine protein kinase